MFIIPLFAISVNLRYNTFTGGNEMDKNRRNRIAIISIMTYYARQIFDETKLYEFRKSPLRDELLNKKIYVYSAKEDKAIIG